MKVKKLIAREGLIIICLGCVASISFLLANWQAKHVTIPASENGAIKISQNAELSSIPDKEIFDMARIPMSQRPIMQRIPFESLGLFCLVFAYPLYLLIRFVVWSVRTLRVKETPAL